MTLREEEEFEKGASGAADEENAAVLAEGGVAVTTLRSSWLHRPCPDCQHTFRLGDPVEIAPKTPVRHVTSFCVSGQPEGEASAEIALFFLGLDEVWPPPEDSQTIRLEPSHRLLAPPTAGFRRHTCVVCGHTLRWRDEVVICPCSPKQPICFVAVHRDPVHGLHCLDSWTAGRTRKYCPVTSRRLDE